MAEEKTYNREYFRVDTFLPLKVNVVPPEARDGLQARTGEFHHLKPCIVNISGGGMSFKGVRGYAVGDLLEIILTLPLAIPVTLCIYGEVLRTQRTANGHYQMFIKFTIIHHRLREMIVNFVFQWEREIMRNTQQSSYTRHYPTPIGKLVEGTFVPFEIYCKDKEGIKFLFSEGLPYDTIAREFFQERGVTKIFVKEEDMSAFDEYIEKTKVKASSFDRNNIVSFKEYSFTKKQHHCIDREILLPRTEISFSLYRLHQFNFTPLIEVTPKLPVMLDETILAPPGDLLIKRSDFPLYLDYVRSLADSAPDDTVLRARIVKEEAKILMNQLLMAPRNKEMMHKVFTMANRLTDTVVENSEARYALLSLKSGDYYPYIHSVNVASMCISMGVAGGMKRDAIEKLAIGALLHDIGHSVINDDIINKQGKLSDTEFGVLKTHVIEGESLLRGHEILPDESLKVVLHHHEKLTGQGYPFGLSGNAISLFGRIAAVADAYDLLVTHRPFREASSSFQAFSTLAREAKNYDPEILKVFIKLFGKVK
ncbi:MAG: HD domain-containing protein [Alphaproteobacteria bacterium]|uniref:HD domain-containing protein n=1 Tax=Candidatus Nitrobium versatile TaxID=2884831 RepID=A0A953JF28_9BACT|nr:HD domain-containing protein [Candidatus Nitrobium versatile]